MRSLLKLLSDLSPRHKLQLGVAWAASLLLVAVVTWGLTASLRGESKSARFEESAVTARAQENPSQETGIDVPSQPTAESADPAKKAKPDTPQPQPSQPAPSRPEQTSPKPPPAATKSSAAKPAPAAKAPATPAPAEAGSVLLDRVLECTRLYRNGEGESARERAEILLSEYVSATALSSAMIEENVGNIRADLLALRVLQIAGRDETSREVARQLKRAHTGTSEVTDTVRLWKILRPRVASVESGIGRGGEIVVSGTVENPDIAAVRRVRVLVEGVDAQGNLVRTVEARVRPKTLDAAATGNFEAILKGNDAAEIVRTRASVSDFQFEVVSP